jgi:hypothetical protein
MTLASRLSTDSCREGTQQVIYEIADTDLHVNLLNYWAEFNDAWYREYTAEL